MSQKVALVGVGRMGTTKAQYDRMTAEGLGGLDKSGIAELTFLGCLGS